MGLYVCWLRQAFSGICMCILHVQQLRVCYKNLKTRVNCFCFLTACAESGKTHTPTEEVEEDACVSSSIFMKQSSLSSLVGALETIKNNDDKIRVKVYEAAATFATVILLYRYLCF